MSRLTRLLRERTFRSLRHRNYRIYFVGQLVSFTGSWMQNAALMWLAFSLTNDPFWPPLLLTLQVGPTLLLGPVGGLVADRLAKRRVILATQAAFMVMAAVYAMLVATDTVSPLWLVLAALANGVIQAIDLPARLAFVPDLVPREDLINAVGLNSLLFNVARAIGPALAALFFLVAEQQSFWPAVRLGAFACFMANVVTYGAVLAALGSLRVPERAAPGATPKRSLWDGLRFFRDNPPYAALIVLTGIFSTFAWPMVTLLPAYTKFVLHRGEQTYSLLVSSLGAGALVAAVLTATYGNDARRRSFLLAGAVCGLLGLVGLATATAVGPAIACCAAMGFGLILYLATGQSTIQLAAPDELRGRVMAFWAMTLGASAPLGHLAAGAAARVYPMPAVMLALAAGVLVTAVGLAWLLRRHFARAEATPPQPLP